MNTLIGFSGKKQAGKDTAYKLLHNLLPGKDIFRIAFADKLKEEVSRATGISISQIDANKENFRLILQGWGTDFRRNLCGEDYWISKWMKTVDYISNAFPACIIVATDIRFENEANVIRSHGGHVYKIVAVGKEENKDEHASEQELSSITADRVLINDFRNVNVLKDQIQQVIKKLKL